MRAVERKITFQKVLTFKKTNIYPEKETSQWILLDIVEEFTFSGKINKLGTNP